MKKFILVVTILIIGMIVVWSHKNRIALAPSEMVSPDLSPSQVSNSGNTIYDKARITKKPFGIYITPVTSPVQPEKFAGYHTGVDFETTPSEANKIVYVPVICNGPLLLKKQASDYGGVAVQSCALNGEAVTVIYGHLQFASINTLVGQVINEGNTIGILGKGYSTETDGERKHLHLSIHKGPTINILGYVQKQSDLSAWLNPADFLK